MGHLGTIYDNDWTSEDIEIQYFSRSTKVQMIPKNSGAFETYRSAFPIRCTFALAQLLESSENGRELVRLEGREVKDTGLAVFFSDFEQEHQRATES